MTQNEEKLTKKKVTEKASEWPTPFAYRLLWHVEKGQDLPPRRAEATVLLYARYASLLDVSILDMDVVCSGQLCVPPFGAGYRPIGNTP